MKNAVTTKELHSSLNLQGYKCNKELAMQVCASLKQKPVGGAFLFGPAGAGKTHLPEVLTDVLEADLHYYQVTQGTREEDLVQKILPSEDTTTGVKIHPGILVKATEATHGDKLVILVLDEWDKTRHSADAFLLDFLQSGRLSFPGVSLKANQNNLLVFITLNDERELSEPLSRRLPKIDFKIMHPELIHSALQDSHSDNEYIDSVVALYKRCVFAGIRKPITIQELRQLLDAVDVLQEDADWNTLVKQYVTKNDRTHKLLLDKEGYSNADVQCKLDKLFNSRVADKIVSSNYDNNNTDVPENNTDDDSKEMPKLKVIRHVDWKFAKYKTPNKTLLKSGQGIYGIIPYNNNNYDAYVHDFANYPKRSARDLPGPASVQGRYIIMRKPVYLAEMYRVSRLETVDTEGEICFVMDGVVLHNVKALQERQTPSMLKFRVFKFSEKEIVGRIGSNISEVRWRRYPNKRKGRLEFLVNLKRWSYFDDWCTNRTTNGPGPLSGIRLSHEQIIKEIQDIDSNLKVGNLLKLAYENGYRKNRIMNRDLVNGKS